ncbi:MAG TPA: hypothetical protein ENJ57_02110, partial [Rhizobiales bacterium]|nr:hypothetical protein [Hyphomicrobiales bacterium]
MEPVSLKMISRIGVFIASEAPLFRYAIIAAIAVSLSILLKAGNALAQEVVYVLPLDQTGADSKKGQDRGTSVPRFEGSESYEADLRSRGLWTQRTRRDLFARSDNRRRDTRSDRGTGEGRNSGEGRGAYSDSGASSETARNSPAGASPDISRMRSGAVAGGTRSSLTRRRSGSQGITEAYSSNFPGDGRSGSAGRSGMSGEEPSSGRGRENLATGDLRQPPLRRTASRPPASSRSAVSDAPERDDVSYGPPEDFGVSGQGTIDPLTGAVLSSRTPVVTGTTGQPPQSASLATTTATFTSAVGAAGTSTNTLVDGAITTVRDQPRPDWDPLGIKVGRFLVRPSVDIETEFTDNAALTSSGKK